MALRGLALIALGLALAADVAADMTIAGQASTDLLVGCGGCHTLRAGAPGSGVVPILISDPQMLLEKLRAYRVPDAAGTVMPRIARGYTDAELEQIALQFTARDATRDAPQ